MTSVSIVKSKKGIETKTMRTIKANLSQYIIFEAAPLKSILFLTLSILLLFSFVNVTIGTSCLGASRDSRGERGEEGHEQVR